MWRGILSTFIIALFWLPSPAFSAGKIKVGVVLDKGGRDDKSFNASAYLGAREAEKKLGIQLKVVESSDDSAIEPSLRTFAQRGYDLVIGIGFVHAAPMKKVAAEFLKTHFLLVDADLRAPNVRSVTFNEHEGSYLVGAIAGLVTKSKVVGFVGGMDIPLIRRFELGYRAGAQSINADIKVLSNYVGATSDAWKNPMKGKELALSQYHRKADIVFVAAGASGSGVFDAAEEMNRLAIGCDSNQNWIKPGKILTSMLKRLDLAVFQAIELEQQGKFQAGHFNLGLAEQGVDYALDSYNRSLITPDLEKKINEIKSKILSGRIKVPDYYQLSATKNRPLSSE